MNTKYQKLIQDLEDAINALDNEIFADRQTKGDGAFWNAHESCKSLSYHKSQIINHLRYTE